MTDDIRDRLTEALTPTEIEVGDDSRQHIGHAGAASGGHYSVMIISERFRGQSLLQRHRLVYDALQPLRHHIHALSIRALVPGEI